MAEDGPLPPAPRAPAEARWLRPATVALLAILVCAVWVLRYRQQVAQEPSWSGFLERIRAGDVVEIQLGPAYAVVREGAGAQSVTYQVRYPDGVLRDAERRAIIDLAEQREQQAKRDELAGKSHPATPVSLSGLAGARPWWRWW